VSVAIIRDWQRILDSEAFHHMSQIDGIVAALRCDDDQFDFGLRLLLRGIAARIERGTQRRGGPSGWGTLPCRVDRARGRRGGGSPIRGHGGTEA